MASILRLDDNHAAVVEKLVDLYTDLFLHEGYGNMSVEIKFLKKGQKEVLIRCGKDYRFVVDYPQDGAPKIAVRVAHNSLAS
ncbi:hypothetical protein DPQ33_11035 [Oceanidesulfovibrio indonesiensis]|uniref:Uncharacterized protein n=1 Tax=Oceanidesulfovibrio indonesiensis TaxID=54767 RepID=A0A7M3MDW7_9BACT|nr:hypothetical protein [Oceanidesulfovibrio indonesiensis]TVM16929.1 hypothetical protein DPQ33_11035 [Oceanidesulfovibrio indonesiensis]